MADVLLTGTFTRLDGTPATGTVRVTPSRSPIMDPDGKIVISGPQTFPLDGDGKLAVEIPASDDPDLGPPFTYSIDVNLTHANWKISKVWIPHGSTTVDLSEIGDYTPTPGVATRVVTIPADGADGQVLVWDGVGFSWDFPPEGPQGPPGEVTTAALTTALAGKVTGTGMTLRHDTSVGTRVFLDHPGGSTMIYGDTGWRDVQHLLQPGWIYDSGLGYFRIRLTTHTFHMAARLKVTPDADFIGTQRSISRRIISLPTGFMVFDTYVPLATASVASSPIQIDGDGPTNLIVTRGTGTWTAGDGLIFTMSVPRRGAWPTALPGTPVFT